MVPEFFSSPFRGEDFKKSANQKQELPVAAMFVNGSERNEQIYKGPSIDTSYQVSAHLAVGSEAVHLLQFLVTSIFEVSQKQKHRRRHVFYGRLTSKCFSLQNVIIDLSNQN
jgi:hypothetical protein